MSKHCFSCGAFGCMLKCKPLVCTGGNYWLSPGTPPYCPETSFFLLTPASLPVFVCVHKHSITSQNTHYNSQFSIADARAIVHKDQFLSLPLALVGHTWQQHVVGSARHLSLYFSGCLYVCLSDS